MSLPGMKESPSSPSSKTKTKVSPKAEVSTAFLNTYRGKKEDKEIK